MQHGRICQSVPPCTCMSAKPSGAHVPSKLHISYRKSVVPTPADVRPAACRSSSAQAPARAAAPENTNQTGGDAAALTDSTLATPFASVPRTPSFLISAACAFASLHPQGSKFDAASHTYSRRSAPEKCLIVEFKSWLHQDRQLTCGELHAATCSDGASTLVRSVLTRSRGSRKSVRAPLQRADELRGGGAARLHHAEQALGALRRPRQHRHDHLRRPRLPQTPQVQRREAPCSTRSAGAALAHRYVAVLWNRACAVH